MATATQAPWQGTVHQLLTLGRLDDASRILSSYPSDPEALRQLARILLHQGQPGQALARLEAAAGLAPEAKGIDYELGVIQLANSAWDEAVRHFRRAIRCRPDDADSSFNLSWALRRSGHAKEAEPPLREALRLRPVWPAAWFNLGNLLLDDLEQPEEAAEAYTVALAQAPDAPECLGNLAMAKWRTGETDEAERLLRRALALQPGLSSAAATLGSLLTALTRGEEAVAILATAVALAPDDPVLRLNLGLALRTLGRLREAKEVLTEASRLAPDHAEVWNALGSVHLQCEEMDEAAEALDRAVMLRPDFADAYSNRANLASLRGRPEEALAAFRKALELAPDDTRIHSNMLFFLTHCRGVTRAQIVEEHRGFGRGHEARIAILPLAPPDRTPGRKLRIGYVSPDFCDHAVTFWFEPVLDLHDRDRFELFCYACGPRHDHVTERLRRCVPHWRSIHALTADAAARVIRDDRIDILVDLAGHSANNALPVFIRKPAPIQASMIGYPFTTGLSRMDYWVSDIYSDPTDDSAAAYSETLERLAMPAVFRPPADAPVPGPPPCASGRPVRFGSLNNPQKITDEVLDAWAQILDHCPGATLLMVVPGGDDAPVRDHFQAAFAGRGIAPRRIETAGTCPLGSFLDLVQGIDIALDPFPYGGGTTTMLTLWMGVPVITLDTGSPGGSVAAGMLGGLQLDHLITRSAPDYVAAAATAAADPEALAALRRDLRGRMANSVIRAEHDFVRALEAAYGRWWERYCTTPIRRRQ